MYLTYIAEETVDNSNDKAKALEKERLEDESSKVGIKPRKGRNSGSDSKTVKYIKYILNVYLIYIKCILNVY